MKTEATPITDDEEAWREVQELLGVSCAVSRRLECSRRRNIRRAWRLRKLNIQRRDDLCAIVRTMAVMNRQRDEAIQIAQEALSDGHRYPCYADERDKTIRCRCGWRDENARLQKLKGDISEHRNLKTAQDCLDSNPFQ